MDDRGPHTVPLASTQDDKIPDSWTARRVVLLTLTVLAVTLIFWLLLRFYTVIFILFVGIVLSIAIKPATDLLHRWKLPLPVAVISVYIGIAIVFVGFTLLVAPLLVDQVTTIVGNIPHYYEVLRNGLISSPIFMVRSFAMQMPSQLVIQAPPPAGS